jgi:carboxylesterase
MSAGTDPSHLSSWRDWYRALEAAHDALKSRCRIILVGGISVGAILALHLARERPADVHGLILYSPTIWPNGWAIPKSLYLFHLIKYKWFARLFHFKQRPPFGIKDERIRNVVIGGLRTGDCRFGSLDLCGGLLWEVKTLGNEVRRGLTAIDQPTHIFHPRDDDQSDLMNAVAIARGLGGAVEMTVLEDSYHLVTLDRQRELVVTRTIDFVRRITEGMQELTPVVHLTKTKAVVE